MYYSIEIKGSLVWQGEDILARLGRSYVGQSTIIYDLDRKPLGCFREIDGGWDASLEVEDEFASLCEGEPFRNIASAVTEVLSARKV